MQISDAEWKILNAIWQGHPATAREVVDRLQGEADWAYTTVKTMLTRLVEKGALSADNAEQATRYVPLVTKQEARRSALASLMNRAFDGAFAPMLQFLLRDQQLSEKDRAELRKLLNDDTDPTSEDRK